MRAVAYDNAGASASSGDGDHYGGRRIGVAGAVDRGGLGSPALSGSTTYSNGVFSVDAAGIDIWGTSDQFQFVYQPVNGDVEIVARVDSLIAVDPFTAAGVMIRGSLQPGSLHGYSTLTGSNGVFFRRRVAADGGTTTSVQVAGVTGSTWVRLVRRGTVVTSSWSTDGTTWSGDWLPDAALGTTAYVGLAVCSDDVEHPDDGAVFQCPGRAAAANQPPTVTLTVAGERRDLHRAGERDAERQRRRTRTAPSPEVEFYNGTTLLEQRYGGARTRSPGRRCRPAPTP